MTTKENIDFDINSYTLDDMYNMFELKSQTADEETLKSIYETKTKKIKQLSLENIHKDKYLSFIQKIYFELLRNIKTKQYGDTFVNKNTESKIPEVQLKQDRYEILQQPKVLQNNSNFFIQTNDQPTQDTFHNSFPKGVINPIRKRTVTKIMSIDTIFR